MAHLLSGIRGIRVNILFFPILSERSEVLWHMKYITSRCSCVSFSVIAFTEAYGCVNLSQARIDSKPWSSNMRIIVLSI